MDAVRLRRVNRWLAQGLGGELADLYVDSRETPAAEAYRSRSRQDFLNRLTGDIRRPGFAMVIAETDHLDLLLVRRCRLTPAVARRRLRD